MAANFSAKALGTFSGDRMMTLDHTVEATLLQTMDQRLTNHPQISVSRRNVEVDERWRRAVIRNTAAGTACSAWASSRTNDRVRLSPDSVAESLYQLRVQDKTAWTHELDLRPWVEPFYLTAPTCCMAVYRSGHKPGLCCDNIFIFSRCRTPHMSIYRPVNRSPRSDVHHVAEHGVGSQRDQQQGVPCAPEQNWTGRRKAKPAEFLFPTTMRWMATLPPEFQPTTIGRTFPRIANALAALWTRSDAFSSYLDDLLIDKRGARQGFPIDALAELHALRGYYAVSRPYHLVVQVRSGRPL